MKPLGSGDLLRLGPYRLLGTLGEGGMGKVYFGQDSLGRCAAVKCLRLELAHDQDLARRFVREAWTARAVTSNGVARVLDAQTEDGRPWIAAEFLAGPTLEEAVTALGPFGEGAVCRLGAALAAALQDIHTAGLVHRDVKPANIVLTSAGPRIIDFGIARPEHGLTLTTTGEVPVTPGYGAPEQVLGHRVGPSADVFSLGAVLVYAATGRRAFGGGHVSAVQYEVVHGEPQLEWLTSSLRDLVAPCLAKDAALRPSPGHIAAAFAPGTHGTVDEWRQGQLGAMIDQHLADVRHVVPGFGAPTTPPAKGRRRFLIALAGAGAALTVGGGTAAWQFKDG